MKILVIILFIIWFIYNVYEEYKTEEDLRKIKQEIMGQEVKNNDRHNK